MDTLQILIIAAAVLLVAGLGWFLTRRKGTDDVVSSVPSKLPSATTPKTIHRGIGTRLSKSSKSLGGALRGVFSRSSLDQEFWESMEEALIAADMGVAAATDIVGRVRDSRPADTQVARSALQAEILAEFEGRSRQLNLDSNKPAIVLVVGVNGAGKTTSIAKLAKVMHSRGRTPLLGAADTFRAAADAQLRTWGERLGVDVVGGQEGADPAAVAFDALAAARARGADVVFIDTAGRLQSKHNLMAELTKIRRILEREAESIDEVLLVLDATAGQNGVSQAEEFARAVGVSGIVLTKLDGTARGGVVVAVERLMDVPVKFVGVGEGMDDLVEFDPADFTRALLADA